MNWTFWMDIVSPHLSALVRAIASMPQQTVTVVTEIEPTEKRKAIGWHTPDCSPARVLIRPQDAEIARLIEGDQEHESVHLLGGLHSPLNRRVLSRLAKTRATVGLISESADNRSLGFVRRAKYCLDRYLVGHNLDFILAMGQLGTRWYESAGYDPSRIFPFAYVTEKPVVTSQHSIDGNESGTFCILYIGQIIRRKDGVTAIHGLERLPNSGWQLDIIGNGPDLPRWKRVAEESGVAGRIRFRPAVDNRMIGNLLEHADLLLLPSRWDGWGAVINEALMCGVPVVCSDKCGAADLLRAPWRGSTFKVGSAENLRCILQGWIERGRRNELSSARIREWSSAIEGPRVARYLVEIIEHLRCGGQRPSPPWY